jgi:hypothetical protein
MASTKMDYYQEDIQETYITRRTTTKVLTGWLFVFSDICGRESWNYIHSTLVKYKYTQSNNKNDSFEQMENFHF